MAHLQKDALILCLDVGLGMQSAPPGQSSHFQKAIEIMSMIIQRKIFAQLKDEVALVLFGCDETNNQLADGESYNNISVVLSLAPADFDMLEHINKKIEPGANETDFLDAITVCLDLFYNETKNKRIASRRIILFTNFNHRCNDDNIEGIIDGFSTDGMNVELVVIGPSIMIEDEDVGDKDDEPGPSSSNRGETLVCRSNVDSVSGKEKSQEQVNGETIIRKVFNSGVGGAAYSYSCATQAVTGFEKRSCRPAAWKCNLTLGNDLSVPCVAYAKTKEAKLKQTWKKCHAKTHKQDDVIANRYYHKNDDDQTEVTKESVGKGYRYGKDVIPFGPDDERQMKYSTDGKTLNVLGFTDQDNAPPWMMMDDQAHYLLSDDNNAAAGLQALIIAMEKQHLCAIACYVYRRGSNPKLVALLPHIRHGYRCLVMVALPFSEDVRPLSFPSLRSGASQPSDEQLRVVDQLITNMSSDGLFEPKENLNPYFQFTYHCLKNRFLNDKGDLPPQSIITESAPHLTPNIQPSAQRCLDDVKRLFPLQTTSEPEATKRWAPLQTNDNDTSTDDATTGTYQPLATITAPSIDNVGTVTPDSDFIAILENHSNNGERIRSAFQQLRERIEEFVSDPFLMKLSNKIITGLKVLVAKSEEHNQVEEINRFLVKIKSKLLTANSQLWDLLIQSDVNLIGEGEYEGYTRDNFLSIVQPTPVDIYQQQDDEQDADDLLDMID